MPPAIDPAQARQVQELKHDSPLIGCRLDPSGAFVFASAQDSTIQRWDLKDGKKTPLVGHKSWVRGLACHPREKLLFTAGYDGLVMAWPRDAAEPKPLFAIDAHKGWVRAVAVSPDGQVLASCGNDCAVRLWSTADGKPLRLLGNHDSHVYNVGFHPGGKFLVSGDLKGIVKVWDLSEGRAGGVSPLMRELDAKVLAKYDETFRADIGGVRSLAFSGDGSLLACSGITEVSNAFAGVGKPAVVLFDWAMGQRKQLLVPKEPFQGTAWGVGFHPEGLIVGVAGGNGGVLLFWKPDQAQAAATVKLPNNARDLDLLPDSTRLVVAFFDGAVRMYDLTPKPAEPKKP
jgi:WD40 repeat protein